jgi:DNA-binding transcriptional LysR family regulator
MALESIEAIRVFVQVVESGSLTAAGRVVGLSPTLVSRRIARLEEELGARLLQRTTRSQTLTEEGRLFYRRALRILADLDEAADVVRPTPGEARGTVRAVLPTIVRALDVMPSLNGFLEQHPGVSIQMAFSDQPVDVVAGGWDVAVHIGRPPESSHIARRLCRVMTGLAATPEYLAVRGIPRTPQDLSDHECLRFISDRPQDHWVLVHDSGKEVVVPVVGRFESDNSAALADAMVASLGIGIHAGRALDIAMAEGSLQPVLPGWRFEGVTLYALIPTGRNRVPRVRAFVDWLAEFMGEFDSGG